MHARIFISALLAGSMLATPALSQQRKTLLDVLFPKVYEKKLDRRKRAAEARRRALASRTLPKVKTSRNYAYKVPKRSLIKLAPIPVSLAVAEVENETVTEEKKQIPSQKVTLMTQDILAAGDMKFSTENFLASAISNFYKENQNYLWLKEDGSWNYPAQEVLKVLQSADEYGLDPEDYAVMMSAADQEASAEVENITTSSIETEADDGASSAEADTMNEAVETEDIQEADTTKVLAQERLRMEISMTNAVLRYAMDASFGAVNPNLLSGYHDFPEHYGQAEDILEKVVKNTWTPYRLKQMHPDNDKFNALKAELAALQGVKDDVIELEPVLIRPGQSNPELPKIVAALKKRGSDALLETHAETLEAYVAGDEKFSRELSALIKDYQKETGLGADGVIGRNTIAKLSGVSSSTKIDRVRLAMERMRWLPHNLGKRHVFINQPEYRARYVENGSEKLSMRVVVGKKSNQTNFFYDEIEHIEYNPYWNVPRSIIVNEFLPKSLNNPGYLDQRGYQVQTWGGKTVSASSINWYETGANPKFAVRQPPGPKNALGELKIMFPNKHSIYMHDTPAKSLFKKQNRAFSHGCIRLHDPRAMAAAVMGTTKAVIGSRVAQGKNMQEKLPSKVPVYVSYFTAWPQADGTVKYFSDMYDRDAHLMKAMDATRKAREIGITS